jgi:hypothetical protein
MKRQVGYCTNLHPGAGLAEMQAKLRRHALAVKQRVSPAAPMGVGLWLSAAAADKLLADRQLAPLADWLADVGLTPFTLNGFPYGDFHEPIVKHRVYEPNWFDDRRFEYCVKLASILDGLLPDSWEGSISTLPLAWGRPTPAAAQWSAAAQRLRELARRLARLEEQKGRLLYLCLEPEPGCLLQRSSDVVRFYQHHLLPGADEAAVLRHIRVCHDICHAAVMFEDQRQALETYRSAGIAVGKVQISSAVSARLDRLQDADRDAAIRQLLSFAEDRYLHQTLVRDDPAAEPQFYEDLPNALQRRPSAGLRRGHWRTHFHVPIYLEQFGLLETTQREIRHCLQAAANLADLLHFEVETYAWGVLPSELRQPELADGVARELHWLRKAFPWLFGEADSAERHSPAPDRGPESSA